MSREIGYLFIYSKMPLFSLVLLYLAKEARSGSKFLSWANFRDYNYFKSVALFVNVPFFLSVGFLLNKGVAWPFLRLKSFFEARFGSCFDYCNPKSFAESRKNTFCFVQTVSKFQIGCTIFTKFLAMLFSVQTDALGP